jgi:hypothetical protein
MSDTVIMAAADARFGRSRLILDGGGDRGPARVSQLRKNWYHSIPLC